MTVNLENSRIKFFKKKHSLRDMKLIYPETNENQKIGIIEAHSRTVVTRDWGGDRREGRRGQGEVGQQVQS